MTARKSVTVQLPEEDDHDDDDHDDHSSEGGGSDKASTGSHSTASSKQSKKSDDKATAPPPAAAPPPTQLPPIPEEVEPKEEAPKEERKSEHFDVDNWVIPQEVKTVVLSKRKKKPPVPGVVSKVVFLRKPEEMKEPEEDEKGSEEEGFGDGGGEGEEPKGGGGEGDQKHEGPDHDKEPETHFVDDIMLLFEDHMPDDTEQDKLIDIKLTQLMDIHRGEVMKKLRKSMKPEGKKFKFSEILDGLKDQGIPCPMNEDFARLYGMHGRWDPDGTVLEYYSPMLRTFIPVNMRGRYRGCWNTDDCVKGLDISNVPPKRDALEGFVDRGRHNNIQEKYDDMASVATDEPHLDYLIEIQSYQASTLPIPIFYDLLHLGMEVANENLRVFVQEEGYPPNNHIFTSAQDHAEQLHRKIQLYGALGLEMLESKRKGLGNYLPQWLKTRDEVIRQIMRSKDQERYQQLEEMEKEANERGRFRRETLEQEMAKKKMSETGKPPRGSEGGEKKKKKRTSKDSGGGESESSKGSKPQPQPRRLSKK